MKEEQLLCVRILIDVVELIVLIKSYMIVIKVSEVSSVHKGNHTNKLKMKSNRWGRKDGTLQENIPIIVKNH